jgi:quercetin dioxygenase-like cupin family protein
MDIRYVASGIFAAAVAVLVGASASAQQQTATRTELMRVPIEGIEGREGVVYTADFAPGAQAPRHTHPGQEFLYVISGSLVLEPEGMAAQTVGAGETATQPAGRAHLVRNASASEPAKALVFILAEKGKPLATPAP